ncbi:MAG: caspase family protein, partial [Cyanobacteria bacterium J06632_22]
MTGPIQNRWAFLVGINDYRDSQYGTLNYCVNDVTTLQSLLEQVGYTVVCLHDQLDARSARFPSRKNIEDEFKQLAQHVGPNDLLLVYFACHGTRAGDGLPRLIAEDTRSYDLANQAVAVADVENWMRDSGAERLVLMLDACHIGVGTDQRNMADPEFIRNVH